MTGTVKMGCAGDERLFSSSKGLFQRDGFPGLQHLQGPGAVDKAAEHDVLHVFSQDLPTAQSGDLLIGVIYEDSVGIPVGNIQPVVHTIQNGKQLPVDLILAPLEQRATQAGYLLLIGCRHKRPPFLPPLFAGSVPLSLQNVYRHVAPFTEIGVKSLQLRRVRKGAGIVLTSILRFWKRIQTPFSRAR